MSTRAAVLLVVLASACGASCSAAEGAPPRRVLAPGEPDVELPDPASLPRPPALDGGTR